MRNLLIGSLILLSVASGCSWFHKSKPDDGFSQLPADGQTPMPPVAVPAQPAQTLVVTPSTSVTGKTLRVNETTPATRFVVLGFPVGKMPPMNTVMGVYRRGSKVAEVKLTGPQSDENIVAEIVAGDPIEGDEARTQ